MVMASMEMKEWRKPRMTEKVERGTQIEREKDAQKG